MTARDGRFTDHRDREPAARGVSDAAVLVAASVGQALCTRQHIEGLRGDRSQERRVPPPLRADPLKPSTLAECTSAAAPAPALRSPCSGMTEC